MRLRVSSKQPDGRQDAEVVVKGLLFMPDEGVEPVFILRASEPAACPALMAYISAAVSKGYDGAAVDQAKWIHRQMDAWKKAVGVFPKTEADLYQGAEPEAKPQAIAQAPASKRLNRKNRP